MDHISRGHDVRGSAGGSLLLAAELQPHSPFTYMHIRSQRQNTQKFTLIDSMKQDYSYHRSLASLGRLVDQRVEFGR